MNNGPPVVYYENIDPRWIAKLQELKEYGYYSKEWSNGWRKRRE
ncbi:6228_t:CDS:2, partial [Acaulospora colombiana]